MEGAVRRAQRRAAALLGAPLNRWVALSEDESRVVAVGVTFQEAAEKAEKLGIADPILVKTPETWAPRVLLRHQVLA